MLFDTHAHYDDEKFDNDRNEIIKKVHQEGVAYILNAASDIASSYKCISISREFDFIYAAVGIHPHQVANIEEDVLTELASIAENKKVVAIGEIGLDYYYDNAPRDIQKYWLAKQINLAKSIGLPVIIHDRDAHEDVLNIVKTENAKTVGGVFHCYSGSVEMAREVLNNNFFISVGGAVTFKNARKLVDVVKYVPIDRLLLETDCPYLAPEPYRGRRNDSGYLKYIALKIAEIKGISFEEIAAVTSQNAKRLFNIN